MQPTSRRDALAFLGTRKCSQALTLKSSVVNAGCRCQAALGLHRQKHHSRNAPAKHSHAAGAGCTPTDPAAACCPATALPAQQAGDRAQTAVAKALCNDSPRPGWPGGWWEALEAAGLPANPQRRWPEVAAATAPAACSAVLPPAGAAGPSPHAALDAWAAGWSRGKLLARQPLSAAHWARPHKPAELLAAGGTSSARRPAVRQLRLRRPAQPAAGKSRGCRRRSVWMSDGCR